MSWAMTKEQIACEEAERELGDELDSFCSNTSLEEIGDLEEE